MKGYEKYLPEKHKEEVVTSLVQGYVPKDLQSKVREIMDKEGWTWDETLRGLLQKFIDDYRRAG